MKKIAITGTIGSGKSYVGNILRTQYHLAVFDVDQAVKEIRNNQAKQEVIDHFGECILTNNEIDPKKLGNIVFNDDQQRKILEKILHPKLYDAMLLFFKEHSNDKLVVVEHPLVYELGWDTVFDEIWLVTCDTTTAIARLVKYREYTEESARQILSKQETNEEKVEKANRVIYNNDDITLHKQIKQIMKEEKIC